MWVISFKTIKKHCLNFMQKAGIMVIIRTKTQQIMLEATIWSQAVHNHGMSLAVFFTPVVALDFVLYQELVIFSFEIQEFLVKSSITSIKVPLYSSSVSVKVVNITESVVLH